MTSLLYQAGLPSYAMSILLFAGYWFLPMVISAWDGTLLNVKAVDRLATFLQVVGSPAFIVEWVRKTASYHAQNQLLSQPYLTDLTHFLFAVVIGCGAWLGTATLRNFDRAVTQLSADGIPQGDATAASNIYRQYRRQAFRTGNIVLCAVLAACTFALFVYLHRAEEYAYWWGSHKHGIAGFVFAVMVGAMVFSLVWGSLLLVFGSLMLARIISMPIELRSFHADGCNGLEPLGRQIFLLWSNALIGGLAIYVTLRSGYLGVERTPIVWILAMIGTLTIPAIAIVPLLASLRAVKKVQQQYLQHLGIFLNRRLQQADAAIQSDNLGEAEKIIGQLDSVRKLFEIYKTANVWPFNSRALTVIVVINAVQIALTAKQLMPLMPG